MTQAILSCQDYLALPCDDQTFLIDSLLPSSGAMLIYGDPKIGKSYAALQLAACLTSGSSWLGFEVPQAVPTIYVQLDTPRPLWRKRILDLIASGHPLEGVHFADRETLDCNPFNIRDPKHLATLVAALRTIPALSDDGDTYMVEPGCVIVDTLRESCSGADENDATEMQEVIAYLTEAVKPAALILIHHAKKPNPEGAKSLMNDTRGSSYVNGRMDCIARFTHKAMYVTSRTIEEHGVDLDRDDDGTWLVKKVPDVLDKMDALILDGSGDATRLKAKVLAKMINKSENACRALLRRREEFLRKSGRMHLTHPASA
jgi:RecA-family ATPase